MNIESWRRFPGDILRTAEKLLSRELLFQSIDLIESFNPYEMMDNESCKNNKYWFADHIQGHSKRARDTIIQNLRERVREIVTIEDGQMKWDPVAVNNYKRSHEKFLEHLSIGFNTLGGLAGRGPEMLSLLYRNTPETDRHIMIQDGQLMTVSGCHKSQDVMDCLKVQVDVIFR